MPIRAWASIQANTRQALDRYSQVLSQHTTRTFLITFVVSVVGDWLNLVALMSLAYEFGDGALGVGGMLALRMVPGLVLQGLAGALVDRMPGKAILIGSQITMGVVAWSFMTLESIESLWLLYSLVVLLETVNTLARPAFMVQLVGSVSESHRGAINGLIGMAMTTAQLVGASIGAIILGPLSPQPLFFLNGLTFIGIAIVVSRVKVTPIAESARRLVERAGEQVSATGGSIGGYVSMIRRPDVFIYCFLTLTVSMLIQAATALFEARARGLSLGEGGAGIFFAAVAIGLLLGGAIAGAGIYRDRTTLHLIAAAEIASALGLVAFGLANTLTIAALALVVTGIAAELAEVPALTYFQHRLPATVYGRFFSLFLMASAAGGLIGALAGPVLERSLGEARALQFMTIPILVSAFLLVFLSRSWGEASDEASTEADAPMSAPLPTIQPSLRED
ncbi:MAG: MFS transporter [Thermomicrobiales bacterium]